MIPNSIFNHAMVQIDNHRKVIDKKVKALRTLEVEMAEKVAEIDRFRNTLAELEAFIDVDEKRLRENDMIAVIFDLETTGLNLPSLAEPELQPRIIEFGAIRVGGDETGFLVNPGVPLDKKITKITGITNEMLEGKFDFETAFPLIEAVFHGADRVICHNAHFDCSVLEYECTRIGVRSVLPEERVCTVQEFKHLFGWRPKLADLYETIVGEPLNQTHRALDDARAVYEIVRKAGL